MAVTDVIDSEDCNDEACIKKMGEMLDVDYTFFFSITATKMPGTFRQKNEIR